MGEFPHHYKLTATADQGGDVTLKTKEGAVLQCNVPRQFGGEPGGHSPESLLTDAVASCFILSFRAIARASNFGWVSIACEIDGILDNVERILKFTGFQLHVDLFIGDEVDAEKADRLLIKAEKSCLVSNSLNCPVHLTTKVTVID